MDKQEFRAEIQELLYGYDNKIPEKILHSTDGAPKVKARRGWFTSVCGMVSLGCTRGFVNGRVHRGYEEFWKYLEQYNHQKSHDWLVCDEDIRRGDELQRITLEELGN